MNKEDAAKKVKALHDKGFGRTIKGFRTIQDVAEFNSKWRKLTLKQLRILYDDKTRNLTDNDLQGEHLLVSLAIQQQGIKGLTDIFGGSLDAVERVLRAGLDFAVGGANQKALVSTGLTLAQEILLDIYVFGTGPTGVPEFESFVAYRQAIAFNRELNRRLAK